jgi:tetratricopeptide (TPR) repeat protein
MRPLELGEAIRLHSKFAQAYGNRCLALFHKKELDRAMTDCNEAVGLDPKLAYAFNGRGLIWAEKREYDRAIAGYDETFRIAIPTADRRGAR